MKMNILSIIDRSKELFSEDIFDTAKKIEDITRNSRFLVIGGAGSIGKAVTIEIFKRNPKAVHVVDISENNLVELVRDIRSSFGYIEGDFKTFAIDCGSEEFEALIDRQESYDYIFNLSALKHVRSEKDPYTMMRMIKVNIFNTVTSLRLTKNKGAKKYFCVSTDKAANPVNIMGASKKIMEMFLIRESKDLDISMARFANVAFSDGSLLHGFNQRFNSNQPISAPQDVKRYFITQQESGELCLLSGLLGENRDIFFPKLSEDIHLIKFSDIAKRYINNLGYEVYECSSEEEARRNANDLISRKKWPCYFFKSDTSGEKLFEEFYTENERLDMKAYKNIGIVKNEDKYCNETIESFKNQILDLSLSKNWSSDDIIKVFYEALPDFANDHIRLNKNLDEKM
tara:strand:- start:462 stop:1661 length:1200 start_codon:yes stop_codon:yes gene_type:complete